MLMWVAVLVAGWCVASLVAALTLGSYLRRRAEATDPNGALRPLDTGPLRLWLGELPAGASAATGERMYAPESPEALTRRPGLDGMVAGLPAPRAARDENGRRGAMAG